MIRRLVGAAVRLVLLVLTVVLLAAGLHISLPEPIDGPVAAVRRSLQAVQGHVQQAAWDGDGAEHAQSYSFMTTNPDGSPGRWNPCEPIRYQVNASQAEPGALEDVQAALAQITAASGLQFQYVGATTEIPRAHHEMRAGGRWAPVTIGWATASQTDMLTGAEAGMGGPDRLSTPSGTVYVSGSVVLDAARNAEYPPGFAGYQTRGTLLLHELGHLVGLGHTDDDSQAMRSGLGAPGRYGAGDLAGLARLGTAAGCRSVPRP